MKTRGHAKRAHSSYRRHRRNSHCHKKGRATCRTTSGCKYTTGKRHYCRKSKNTHASTFRHKQRGGSSLKETLPYGSAGNLAFGASKVQNGGKRRRHNKKHHSKKHHSRRKHHSKKHHSKKHHKKHHRRRKKGGNASFLLPAVLLAAQKLVQQHGLGTRRRSSKRSRRSRRSRRR